MGDIKNRFQIRYQKGTEWFDQRNVRIIGPQHYPSLEAAQKAMEEFASSRPEDGPLIYQVFENLAVGVRLVWEEVL